VKLVGSDGGSLGKAKLHVSDKTIASALPAKGQSVTHLSGTKCGRSLTKGTPYAGSLRGLELRPQPRAGAATKSTVSRCPTSGRTAPGQGPPSMWQIDHFKPGSGPVKDYNPGPKGRI
jgi:hypothetical protein